MIANILAAFNLRLVNLNMFDKIYGLSELNPDVNKEGYVHYIGNGEAEHVTNYDVANGTLFWVKNGKVNYSKFDFPSKLPPDQEVYKSSYPVTAYCVVKKKHLPCNSAEAQDYVGSEIIRVLSGALEGYQDEIAVMLFEAIPDGYDTPKKALIKNMEYVQVAVNFTIETVRNLKNICYQPCTD